MRYTEDCAELVSDRAADRACEDWDAEPNGSWKEMAEVGSWSR